MNANPEGIKALVEEAWTDVFGHDRPDAYERFQARIAALTAVARDAEVCGPIERDERMERDYIPMPGGWEIQTKGKGSTFRICDKDGDRLAIPDSPYLHETLTRMARDINEAARALNTRQAVEGMVAERLLDALDAACGEFARRTGGCQRVCWYGYTHADRIATVAAAIAAAAPQAGKGGAS